MEKVATTFAGFPAGTRSLPVPSPLLGSLLAEIGDVAELKCTLRFLWHAAQVKGAPKAVPTSTLESDPLLVEALGSIDEVRRGIRLAVQRGTLIEAAGRYLLHTPENERAAERLAPEPPALAMEGAPSRMQADAQGPPNVYAVYESNIGMLTPMIADQLRQAEAEYPPGWIEAAIREAVERNVRNWRYISAILERWASQGRGPKAQGPTQGQGKHGESGRHSEKASAAEYLRRRRAAG